VTIDEIIIKALREDIGEGDHTSLSTIPANAQGKGRLLIKEDGVLAGVEIARKVFFHTDDRISMTQFIEDGARVKNGDIAFEVTGPSIALLTAERTALNFMQRMSGIATQTRMMVDAIEGLPAKILDTRKTTPLLREFEKMAVKLGGGFNHRFGLYDMILIKDNHIDFAGGIAKAIISCHEYMHHKGLHLPIEIETRNLEEVNQVLEHGGVTRIMLDNFSFELLRQAVSIIGDKYETEASGGINLETIRQYAECGVNFISVGSLTHHINSLDMSLKAVK
jgi:nicotinate-nucleotide pyrophosphorylase (carboxylating)